MRGASRPETKRTAWRTLRFAAPCAVFGVCLTCPAASAQDGIDYLSGGILEIDVITVTASKVGEPAYGALSPSSVLTRGELQQIQADDLTEILTLVPSVTTQTTPSDPGTAVSVRGLQDFGRTNVLVDGARQNFQKSGHGANGTFFLDTEMLRAVDVTRGPSSTVNGSGAIGGIVSFTTLNADDVLHDDETVAAAIKSTAESNAPAIMVHGEAAARLGDRADIAVAGTWREADDYTTGNGTKIRSGQELLSGLAKARLRPGEHQEITLSALHFDSEYDSSLTDTVTNHAVADTYTAGYKWDPLSDLADLNAKTYYTTTRLKQSDKDDGTTRFEIGTFGADIYNTARFETGRFGHALTIGLDGFHDQVHTNDPNGTADDLTPSGERVVYGAFIEDRIDLTSRIELIGALRADGYRIWDDDIDNSGSNLSPKITFGYQVLEPVTVYATYAQGFRAPALTETLIDGFHPPPVSTGRFLPNPDLKPERAETWEAGLNYNDTGLLRSDDQLHIKFGGFHNRVDDFIEQVFSPFPIPGGYKYENIAEATIKGLELDARYETNGFFAALTGQIMKGTNSRTKAELSSVPPNRIIAIAGVRLFQEALEVGTRITASADKKDAAAFGLVGDAYQTVDVFASWSMTEDTELSVYLANIFDEQFTQYPNGSPSPGFNAKVSFKTRFGG